ncbi:UPF0175 family protein [Olivibacter jilunii]
MHHAHWRGTKPTQQGCLPRSPIAGLLHCKNIGTYPSGVAARLLNIDRATFLNILGKYHVSYFQLETKEDLSNDLENA